MRLVPGLMVVVLVCCILYPFFSGFMHNTGSNKSALIGEWVGTVNIQNIASPTREPSATNGNAVMRVTFRPVIFSFLSKLTASGEVTDAEGHVRTFRLQPFMQPFQRTEGRVAARSVGISDDSLTGTWDRVKFTNDKLELDHVTGGEAYQLTGILLKGTDEDYRSQTAEMERLALEYKRSHGK